MKFLFRSSDALCLPQALRVQSEGNKVRLSVDRPGFERMGDGFVDKVMNFDAAVDWADVVVYDVQEGKLPDEADKLRAKGKPVVGTSALGQQLEHDRKFGIDFARKAGIMVPEVAEFNGRAAFAQAREFLHTKPANVDWVLKINGKAPEGVGTFVSKDGRTGAMRMLKHWEEMYCKANIRPDFVVTKRIDGCEISTEAWFNGNDFVLPNHTLERTKFFPGDLGEKVGCTGNVVWLAARESPLVQKLLLPLTSQLAGRFVGPLDVNVIIERSSNEPVFLEFSPRFGYDAVFALMELFDSDFGEFLYQVASKQPAQYRINESLFAGDVRLCIPPYPAKGAKESSEECQDVPVFGIDKRAYNRHQHLVEVCLDYDNEVVTSGPHGFVLSVTGRGDTARTAQEAAYKQIDKIRIPNMRYRNDLVDAIGQEYSKVEDTGWLDQGTEAKPISLLSSMSRPLARRKLGTR